MHGRPAFPHRRFVSAAIVSALAAGILRRFPVRNFRTVAAYLLNVPLNRKDGIFIAHDGNCFARGRENMHLYILFIRISGEFHGDRMIPYWRGRSIHRESSFRARGPLPEVIRYISHELARKAQLAATISRSTTGITIGGTNQVFIVYPFAPRPRRAGKPDFRFFDTHGSGRASSVCRAPCN